MRKVLEKAKVLVRKVIEYDFGIDHQPEELVLQVGKLFSQALGGINLAGVEIHAEVETTQPLIVGSVEEFTGVVLCLVSNRFLYLSSPISKLTDMLYSCLREATKVKTLTDLNSQVLTSQNIPVIIERFINFIFEHGLESKGETNDRDRRQLHRVVMPLGRDLSTSGPRDQDQTVAE